MRHQWVTVSGIPEICSNPIKAVMVASPWATEDAPEDKSILLSSTAAEVYPFGDFEVDCVDEDCLHWRAELYPVFMLRAKINDKPPFLLSASTQARFPDPKSATSFFLLPFLITSSPQKWYWVRVKLLTAWLWWIIVESDLLEGGGVHLYHAISSPLLPASIGYTCVCVRAHSHALKP